MIDVIGLTSLLASGILLQIDSQYEIAIGQWLWKCGEYLEMRVCMTVLMQFPSFEHLVPPATIRCYRDITSMEQ